jgi:cytidylate kinase
MSIITISREFGSGGREVGKRLADAMGYAYYDREIVAAIAQRKQLDEGYVASALEGGLFRSVPIHFGRTFSYTTPLMTSTTGLFVEQHKLLRELAEQGNCVIVGRAADAILAEHRPFNIFVYADMEAKVRRCMERAEEDEKLTQRELIRHIKKVDADRARYHELFSDTRWGAKESYHLCVNTTGKSIKSLIPAVAQYAKYWLEQE